MFRQIFIYLSLALDAAALHSFMTDDVDMLHHIDTKSFLDNFAEDTKHLSVDGTGLTIEGIFFHLPPGETSMFTNENYSLPEGSLVKRTQPSCFDTPECNNNGPFKFFDESQEEFISGKMCNLLADYGPTVAGVTIGFVAGNALCAGNPPCVLVASIVTGVGFAVPSIAQHIEDYCHEAYSFIRNKCNTKGGGAACTTQTGNSGEQTLHVHTGEPNTVNQHCSDKLHCKRVTCDSANHRCDS